MSKYKKVEAKEHGNILYIPDKYLGHTLSPNCHAFFKRKYSKENYFTNNLGWRVNKLGEKANKVDEEVPVADLKKLTNIYRNILENYFRT